MLFGGILVSLVFQIAQRRQPDKVDPSEVARVREEQEEILKRGTDDDVSVRAKSSGHGKKTADKWNQ